MAYLVRRPAGRFDVRESLSTAQGPRSRTLVSFLGPLTPDVLDAADRRATRPFDRARIEAAAIARGIPVTQRRADLPARELLGALRAGAPVDPGLLAILRDALDERGIGGVPAPLADVAEWVGADLATRGAALRDLLRLSSRIADSRRLPRTPVRAAFPRIRSRPRRRAA